MDKYDMLVSNIFLFKGIDQPFSAKSLGEIVSFKKGEDIYNRQNYKKALAVLLKGCAQALSDDSNADLKSFVEGNVFGAAAVFGSKDTYISRIVAKKDCDVLFISEETLCKLFKEYPVTATNYISFLSSKIRFLNQKISLFTKDSAESKLYSFLCANQNAEKLNFSKLTKTLGIGRTSLYRALNSLEQKNLITKKDGKVSVLK